MKRDYSTFDHALLVQINSGCNTAGRLNANLKHLSKTFCRPGREEYRFLDLRLQALRRAGKIRYDRRTGWKLV